MRFVIGALAVLFACTACDALSPDDVAGTYVLSSIAGDPLPAIVYQDSSIAIEISADTLLLEPRGSGSQSSTVRMIRADTVLFQGTTRTPLTFAVVRDRVEISYVCPINALCVEGPHLVAQKAGDGLRMDFAGGRRVPQHYVRVRR